MKYRITAIWDEELHEANIERARTGLELDLRDSMDHMEFENLRLDVQELPRMPVHDDDEALMLRHEVIWPPDTATSGVGQTYPDDAPRHPWDDGMWIFPDDHPLAGYERAAKMKNDEGEKQSFLEAGQKMLPSPLENDDS